MGGDKTKSASCLPSRARRGQAGQAPVILSWILLPSLANWQYWDGAEQRPLVDRTAPRRRQVSGWVWVAVLHACFFPVQPP